MEPLNIQLWRIAKEYTRQMAILLSIPPQHSHWIGTDDSGTGPITVCDLGADSLFFTLADMQTVIDNMPEWQEKYAPGKDSTEQRNAVAKRVRDWAEWAMLQENHIDGRPGIRLSDWLADAYLPGRWHKPKDKPQQQKSTATQEHHEPQAAQKKQPEEVNIFSLLFSEE